MVLSTWFKKHIVKLIKLLISTLLHSLGILLSKKEKGYHTLFLDFLMSKSCRDCVLDFGCNGRGRIPEPAEHYKYVVGIDLCLEDPKHYSLKRAKSLIKKLRLNNVDLVQADYHKPPFRGSVFDAVIITHVIEHLMKPEEALKECRRILKPMGYVFIEIPYGTFVRLYKELLFRSMVSLPQIYGFTLKRKILHKLS